MSAEIEPPVPEPAVPASGATTAPLVIKQGSLIRTEIGSFHRESKKARYFFLLFDELAIFRKSADAVVTSGRLTASYQYASLSSLRSHGACIPLRLVKDVRSSELDIIIVFEDRDSERLQAASAEEAAEWAHAIHEQVNSVSSGARRDASAPAPVSAASPAAPSRLHRLSVAMSGSARNLMSAVGGQKAGPPESVSDKIARVVAERGQLVGRVKAINKRVLEHGQLAAGRHTDRSVGGSVSEEPGSITPDSRKDSDAPHTVAAKRATYTATAFSGPLPLSSYKDAHGHDAAVLRGWLTRPSKGALGAGQRERYFVLTPQYLAYFANEKDAAIVNDYLTGRCGLKATSVFSQAGVGWPLETIVGVAAFEDAERERNQVKMERALARAEMEKTNEAKQSPGRPRTWSDSDDDSGEGTKPARDPSVSSPLASSRDEARAAMTTRRTSLFASISRMALRHDGDGVKLDAMAPEAKSTLIEVDLGERILLLQAWNLENRDAWIRALLEWSGKRRQYVDNEVVFGRRSNLPIVTKP